MIIFEHENYLPWVKYAITDLIEDDRSLSVNKIAKQMGLSQSHLSLVLAEKRGLSESSAEKFSELLQLTEMEKNYFTLLVRKDNTKDSALKSFLMYELEKFRKSHKIDEIELQNFRIISEWYFSAILEVVQLTAIPLTATYISKRLSLPRYTVQQALAKLVELGFLRGGEGNYKRADSGLLSTPKEFTDLGVRRFQAQMFKKARTAIHKQSISERHFSGATMSINLENLPIAKMKIEQFKSEMIALLEVNPKSAVYQLSIQLFRLDENPDEIKS